MSNLIVASWLLYVGFMPAATLKIDDVLIRYDNTFIQAAGFDFNVAGYFRIWTEIEIREVKTRSVYFDPYRAGFRIGTDFFYKDLILGFVHECNHDIITGHSLNPYNGVDMAYNCLYAGWSAGFPVHPNILLKPGFFLGYRQDGIFLLKRGKDEEKYFDLALRYVKSTPNFFSRALAEADFYDLVKVSFACQPEYSISGGEWSRIRFDTGIEAYYRNIAIGIEGKNQVKFQRAIWAFNELRFYVSFKGKSSLL